MGDRDAANWEEIKKQALSGSSTGFDRCLDMLSLTPLRHTPARSRSMFLDGLAILPHHIREDTAPSTTEANPREWATSKHYRIFRIGLEILMISADFVEKKPRLDILRKIWPALHKWVHFGIQIYLQDIELKNDIPNTHDTTNNLLTGLMGLLVLPWGDATSQPGPDSAFYIPDFLYIPLVELAAKCFTKPTSKTIAIFVESLTGYIEQILHIHGNQANYSETIPSSDANRVAELLIPLYYHLLSARPIHIPIIWNFLDIINRVKEVKLIAVALWDRSLSLWTGRMLNFLRRHAPQLSSEKDYKSLVRAWSSAWIIIDDGCNQRGAPALLQALESKCLHSASRSKRILDLEVQYMHNEDYSPVRDLVTEFLEWVARYSAYRSVLVHIVHAMHSVGRRSEDMEQLQKMGKKLFDIYWQRAAALKDYDWHRKRNCGNRKCEKDADLRPGFTGLMNQDDLPPLYQCSGCMTRSYCSKACQRAHWKEHQIPCQDTYRAEADHVSRIDHDFIAYLILYVLDDHLSLFEDAFLKKKQNKRIKISLTEGAAKIDLLDVPPDSATPNVGLENKGIRIINVALEPYIQGTWKKTLAIPGLLCLVDDSYDAWRRLTSSKMSFVYDGCAPQGLLMWRMSDTISQPMFL